MCCKFSRKVWDLYIFFGDVILIQLALAIFKTFEDTKQKFVSFETFKSVTKAKGFDHIFGIMIKLKAKYGCIKKKLKKLASTFPDNK